MWNFTRYKVHNNQLLIEIYALIIGIKVHFKFIFKEYVCINTAIIIRLMEKI